MPTYIAHTECMTQISNGFGKQNLEMNENVLLNFFLLEGIFENV